ncbi:MAG: YkgJ family cysteine cluster protein, partial [Planctomycetes bacterium]|nr:YkgJ family cysteine cluster protein [Planctomycetota bacterium]
MSDCSTPEGQTIELHCTLSGRKVNHLHIPAGPVRPRTMLPVFQVLTDVLVDQGIQTVADKGEQVSCRKGCAACCRQLIPLTPIEARHLHELVGRLPEPRRSEVRARFMEARRRLQEAGLLPLLEDQDQIPIEEVDALGARYMALGLPCPFLKEEACSIYPERPLACREYLVTSPAEHCARLAEGQIRGVPLSARMSQATARLDQEQPPRRMPFVPLVLALDWAEAHPDEECPPRLGIEILQEVF